LARIAGLSLLVADLRRFNMSRERLVRLQIMLDNDELEAIETWRFQTRMPSRAAAVRELMRRGLAAEGFKVAQVGGQSENYGVINSPAPDGEA
jgi:hypothetical protein